MLNAYSYAIRLEKSNLIVFIYITYTVTDVTPQIRLTSLSFPASLKSFINLLLAEALSSLHAVVMLLTLADSVVLNASWNIIKIRIYRCFQSLS